MHQQARTIVGKRSALRLFLVVGVETEGFLNQERADGLCGVSRDHDTPPGGSRNGYEENKLKWKIPSSLLVVRLELLPYWPDDSHQFKQAISNLPTKREGRFSQSSQVIAGSSRSTGGRCFTRTDSQTVELRTLPPRVVEGI